MDQVDPDHQWLEKFKFDTDSENEEEFHFFYADDVVKNTESEQNKDCFLCRNFGV